MTAFFRLRQRFAAATLTKGVLYQLSYISSKLSSPANRSRSPGDCFFSVAATLRCRNAYQRECSFSKGSASLHPCALLSRQAGIAPRSPATELHQLKSKTGAKVYCADMLPLSAIDRKVFLEVILVCRRTSGPFLSYQTGAGEGI